VCVKLLFHYNLLTQNSIYVCLAIIVYCNIAFSFIKFYCRIF
jgi:hypothetical protein